MFKSLKFNRCLRNLGSQDPEKREKATHKLGDLGDTKAVEPLIESLADVDGNVRKASAQALTKHGQQKWQQRIKGHDLDDFIHLGNSGVSALVAPLIKALSVENPPIRRAITAALGKLGDKRAVRPLIRVLRDKDSSVKIAVITALGQLGDKQATKPLFESLRDHSNPDVRRVTAEAFGILGDERAVPVLIDRVRLESDLSILKVLAGSLVQLLGREAVEPLFKMLKHKCESFRWHVAQVLVNLCDNRNTNILIEMLSDRNREVRRATAEALGQLGDKSATQPLIDTLKDSYSGVRQAAAVALCQLGDPKAIEPLREGLRDRRLCPMSVEDLSNFADEDLVQDAKRCREGLIEDTKRRRTDDLLRDLTAPSHRIREAAARSLIKLALSEPSLIREQWGEIGQLIRARHSDSHADAPGSCEVIMHGDHHTDYGIGLDFPENPPNKTLDF